MVAVLVILAVFAAVAVPLILAVRHFIRGFFDAFDRLAHFHSGISASDQ